MWDESWKVPELDKKFFFLDDDQDFEPNLIHHGLDKYHAPNMIYDVTVLYEPKFVSWFLPPLLPKNLRSLADAEEKAIEEK